jgi:hypothetical protein
VSLGADESRRFFGHVSTGGWARVSAGGSGRPGVGERAQADAGKHGRARARSLGMGEIPPWAWLHEG